MANGQFAYMESSVTYDPSAHTTLREWALQVHLARCAAFYRATDRAAGITTDEFRGYWSSINFSGSSYPVFNSIIYTNEDGTGSQITIRTQDRHPSSVDPNGQYPAFVTIFEAQGCYAQYAIITSLGFTNNSSHESDPSKGLFVASTRLCGDGGTYKHIPISIAHCFAANGFGTPNDILTGNPGNGELTISECAGLPSTRSNSTTSTASTNGIVRNPVSGKTYTFGYAVKGLTIECFYKTSTFPSNSGMMWSIIGRIFDGDVGLDDSYHVTKFPFGYFAPYTNLSNEASDYSLSSYTYFDDSDRIDADVLKDNGVSYRYDSILELSSSNAFCIPSYAPFRSKTSAPDKLVWAAGGLSFTCNAGYNQTRNYAGIDGNGNNTKGFFRTDVFRFVSIFATRVGGSTYQGGNFVAMYSGTPMNGLEFGVLLGWDESNRSIL